MPSVLKNLLEPSTFARSDEPVRHARLFALGGTGSSSVSLAVSQSAAGVCKLVVLKTLGSARSGDAPAAEGLLDEARSTARMNHPNIVQVFGGRTGRVQHLSSSCSAVGAARNRLGAREPLCSGPRTGSY